MQAVFLEVTFSRYLGTRIARIWEYSGGLVDHCIDDGIDCVGNGLVRGVISGIIGNIIMTS